MRVPVGGEPLLTVQVPRSSGKEGGVCTVSWLPDGRWTGTCPGAVYRGTCKHIGMIRGRIDSEDISPGGELL